MSNKIDKALKKVKLWQEEAKLVCFIMAAISSVAIFVTKMMSGNLSGSEKLVEHSENMVMNDIPLDYVPSVKATFGIMEIGLILLFVASIVLIVFSVLKLIKKHKIAKGIANGK